MRPSSVAVDRRRSSERRSARTAARRSVVLTYSRVTSWPVSLRALHLAERRQVAQRGLQLGRPGMRSAKSPDGLVAGRDVRSQHEAVVAVGDPQDLVGGGLELVGRRGQRQLGGALDAAVLLAGRDARRRAAAPARRRSPPSPGPRARAAARA